MSTMSVHLFSYDPAFSDRRPAIRPTIPVGGVGALSQEGMSYFQNMYSITDRRAIGDRQVGWPADSLPVLIVDDVEYEDVVTALQSVSPTQMNKLFNIVDKLVFNRVAGETSGQIETLLTTNSRYTIYKAASKMIASTTRTDNVYRLDDNTNGITAPTMVRFTAILTVDSVDTEIEFTVWTTDQSFRAEYPIAKIMAIVPPLPYQRLLTDNITGTGANSFQTAAQIANLSRTTLENQIKEYDASGYISYEVRVYDVANNVTTVPFNILYKGQVPDRLQQRLALQSALLGSGVGNEAAWKLRIPELFVENRFYILPQWNNVTVRTSDQVVYPSTIKLPLAVGNTKTIFDHMTAEYVDANVELLTSFYDSTTMTAVGHEMNEEEQSLRDLHPAYVNLPTTNPAFWYMPAETQTFATQLATVLAIAAGKSTNVLYPPITDRGVIYISFTVQFTEYMVVTKESFENIIGL